MSEAEGGQHPSTCAYDLRPIVEDIPLSADDTAQKARITCVELWEDNLYVGTSLAEILHFVSIPPNPKEPAASPTYIFASRLQPAHNASPISGAQGVQQILVLSNVQKACILCDGTLSFYTLPELSPAFNNTTVPNCTWVGGVDLNSGNDVGETGVVVMICVKSKVRLVRIRDEARRVRDIEYPGCLVSVRRGNFACVADSQSYALLDVENQQKISLFPISSLDDNAAGGKVEDISAAALGPGRSPSSSRPESSAGGEIKGHGRSTSLGTFVSGLGRRQESPRPGGREQSGLSTPEPALRDLSPAQPSHTRAISAEGVPDSSAMPSAVSEKPLPRPPRFSSLHPPPFARTASPLKPHICSPTPGEFMLVTGTSVKEAGVGIFVNLDGDVVRGTLEFSRYPSAVVMVGSSTAGEDSPLEITEDFEGFLLAIVKRSDANADYTAVEIQRWDVDNGGKKEWMQIPNTSKVRADEDTDSEMPDDDCGLRTVDAKLASLYPSIGNLLRGKRLLIARDRAQNETSIPRQDWELAREKEEVEFGQRLSQVHSNIVLWSGSSIWWTIRTPLITRLEAAIDSNISYTAANLHVDRGGLIHILNDIRGKEANTETDFLSLGYIRQRISVVLFTDLLSRKASVPEIAVADLRITEGLLIEGAIDPRVILSLLPLLAGEVIEGPMGIWIHAGLVSSIERYSPADKLRTDELPNREVTSLLKRYLGAWRQRKGFGSVADEAEVFQTVDAALLRLLILQDLPGNQQPAKISPERAELYALVDSGIDCFDRAVTILEEHNRLYVLSRLYQSRRLGRKVLATWRRIIEGERDDGGGFVDGENEVRRYLINIKDTALVDEYGTWLAKRNPKLGVQVFTNESSKVKWEPHQVIMLLRRRAPDSVKEYLEHLVFGKKQVQYANDLISYYLDNVLAVLESSEEARSTLLSSYETYRALHPPKPTYRQFIMDNSIPQSWWQDRLRLLELIGGSHGSDFTYDVDQVLSRIEPFEQYLVPESIILDGRQGRHKQALRLLTHGLGDYHTAVNYCLLRGASIFHPTQGSITSLSEPSQEEQAKLFGYLLTEFLEIENVSDRLERTSELLKRFSSWYDISDVLDHIPESWSVELISEFLVSSFRRLVGERNEAVIAKALSGAENLQTSFQLVEKCTAMGPQKEAEAQHSHEQQILRHKSAATSSKMSFHPQSFAQLGGYQTTEYASSGPFSQPQTLHSKPRPYRHISALFNPQISSLPPELHARLHFPEGHPHYHPHPRRHLPLSQSKSPHHNQGPEWQASKRNAVQMALAAPFQQVSPRASHEIKDKRDVANFGTPRNGLVTLQTMPGLPTPPPSPYFSPPAQRPGFESLTLGNFKKHGRSQFPMNNSEDMCEQVSEQVCPTPSTVEIHTPEGEDWAAMEVARRKRGIS